MSRYHKLSIIFLQKHHSENKGLDKVMETQAQVDELKGIMVRNIGMFDGIVHIIWEKILIDYQGSNYSREIEIEPPYSY